MYGSFESGNDFGDCETCDDTHSETRETNSPLQAASGAREQSVAGVALLRHGLFLSPFLRMETQAKRARSVLAIAYDTTPTANARTAGYSLGWKFDATVVGLFLVLGVLNIVG